MKAVILTAGMALRLRPLTDATPKCLLKVKNKPILGQILENLAENGIDEFVIVTGYLREQVLTYVETQYPELKITFIYNEVYDSTNNIYSLWLTKNEVAGESFLLLDGDIVFDKQIVELLNECGHPSALALRSSGHVGEEDMKVMADKKGFVKEINKSMNPAEAAGESIGIELFSAETSKLLFDELHIMMEEENKVNVWYEEAFQRIINKGVKIAAVDVHDLKCMELDTVEDFEQAEKIDF
ncbi:MAG: phosphocholine cytidylyltransferase family protein [Calditrichaceae bacterium]|nr:phosphocholine cytidylyltransferase family protein [Calditrichaceae bacterium]MBN2708682.1 phosphocholine cytidylyltransferase family protein [Calditrichaceae bacterium]RQV96769.1 MAG: phosphocholine cytidylyltransferase family protein [Calditrichota bacterium]